jgi:hypothetical protein
MMQGFMFGDDISMEHMLPTFRASESKSDARRGRSKAAISRLMACCHTAFLVALFIVPLVVCCRVVSGPNVSYFMGPQLVYLLCLVPVLVFVPMLHLWHCRLSGAFYLGTVWCPAIVLICVTGAYREKLTIAQASLASSDCYGFEMKGDLQRAYDAAKDLKATCEPAYPGMSKAHSVVDCEGYGDLWGDFAVELDFLQEVEGRSPCAGICTGGQRLWDGPNDYVFRETTQVGVSAGAPACGPFVSEWLKGAQTRTTIVLAYSILVVALSIPGYSLFLEPMIYDGLRPLLEEA